MGVQQDIAAARAAVTELQRAVASLRVSFQDSLDVRRLELDTQRIAEDLGLLAGPETSGPPPVLEVIEDREYPPEFWAGAESEGIGPR